MKNMLCMVVVFLMATMVFGQTAKPVDANLGEQGVIYLTPDSLNFWAATIWFQAATLQPGKFDSTAMVEVDYVRVLEYDIHTKTITERCFEEYEFNNAGQNLDLNQGGLYPRYPSWFATNESLPMENSIVDDFGKLTVNVGEQPNYVNHWWLPRFPAQPGRVFMVELSIKISGAIGFQVGCDFWKDYTAQWAGLNVNNTEAWHSNWYGDTKGEYITIITPLIFP